MCVVKPLKLSFQKVEAFHITHNRGLPGRMRSLEVGCRKGATQAMTCDHFIHPIEATKMVFVELARVRRAHGAEDPGGIPALQTCQTGPSSAGIPPGSSAVFLPRMGPSGTSARQATANDPARIPFA